MKSISRQLIVVFTLVSFMLVILFGFNMVMHGSESSMANDCPFSATGQTLCPQNIVGTAIHHISAYHSFLNFSTDLNLFLAIILLSFAVYFLFFKHLLFGPPRYAHVFYDSPPKDSYRKKLFNWLAIFENSPSHN